MKDKLKTWEEAVIWMRNQPQYKDLFIACYYDDPITETAVRFYKSSEWQEVKKKLPAKHGIALDIGSGRGISSYALAKDGWTVIAGEPDNSKIVGTGSIKKIISETDLPIHVTQVFAESLPFKDNSFDLVYGRQVLHHAADLKNMACELSRVLKPGGAFIATREHVISHPDDLNTFLNNHPLHHIYGKENAYLLKDYISSLNNAGIKLNEVINPFESDINRFPQTLNDIKYNLAKMIHFPFPNLIPQILIKVYGDHISTPGRLYSFLGVKQ